jgi:hypothetical protein
VKGRIVAVSETFRRTLLGGGARSSLGYKVFFNHQNWVAYVDGSLKAFVFVEVLVGSKSLALDPVGIHVGSTKGPRLEDDSVRERIIDRVRRAGAFLGWTIE